MLDIQFIRENAKLVEEKSRQKGYDVDIEQLLGFDQQRRQLQQQVETLRQQRNELAESTKGAKPSDEQIARGKQIKEQLADLEHKLTSVDKEFRELWSAVPNMPLEEVPVGASEDDNVAIKTVGEKPTFDFEPKSDAELGSVGGIIDKERAAKVSGARFAYLKGGLVQLQFAIIQFVLDSLTNQATLERIIADNNLSLAATPFVPVLPPALIRTDAYEASARLDAEEVTYKLANDELWLNASAEHSMCTMYMNETLDEQQLPIRYLGYSTSFRREAGSYGKDTEGIFRMHQFDKLEMEVFSTGETGLEEHKLLVAIQEYLVQQLALPYQLLQKCTADIGKPNAQGVDINTWMPAQQAYRETHTADYMTDYQARRLQTKVRRTDGSVQFVHTNDATAFALGRIMKAIMENYQTADGNIIVPEALRTYLQEREVL